MIDTKFEMILEMLFLKLINADVSFSKRTLTWKSYITNEVLSTIKQVQIIDPKNFVIMVLDADSKTFVGYVAIQEWKRMPMYLEKRAQI